MGEIISIRSRPINVSKLKANVARVDDSMILPAKEITSSELAPEHAAEPIKKLEDIYRVSQMLIREGKYRDNMLFIVGINFGLRVSDLRMLRFSNLINDNLTFRESFPVFEKKTRNTRKRKKNRYITINQAVIEAVTLYLKNTPGISLSDYMFVSEAQNATNKNPLTARSIERLLKNAARDADLGIHVSTHTLRKTFCYHQMMMDDNSNRKLLLLQKMLGHSSPAQTLDYIGITDEEMASAYKELNLGYSDGNYLAGCTILERDVVAT